MTTIYFNNYQKQQFVDFLSKYVSMYYLHITFLLFNLLSMWILKNSTRIKQKVSVPWHWNSVNEANMLLPKNISTNFFLQRYDRSCFRSVTC